MQEHARAILGLDVSPFVVGIKKAQKATKGLGRQLKGALGFFGIGFAMSSIGASVARFADTLVNTSSKLGVSTDFLQAWNFQANQIGVSTNAANMGLQRFTRRIGEAARGTGVLANVIRENNISLRDSQGNMRSTTDILADYADVIQNAESQQERLRLAFQAFDSEGAALVTMLQDGSEGMREMIRNAERLGAITDQRALVAINRLTNKLRTLGTQGLGFVADKFGKFLDLTARGWALFGALSTGATFEEAREIANAQADVEEHLNRMRTAQQMASAEIERQISLEKERLSILERQAQAAKNREEARSDRSRHTVEELSEQNLAKELQQHFAINRARAQRVQMIRQQAEAERRRGREGAAVQLEQQATYLQRLIQAGGGINLRHLFQERMRAQRVQALEAEAGRLGRLGLFQPSQDLFDRALQLRQSMSRLTAAEQNPMRNVEAAVERSNAELERVNGQLETVRNNIADLNQ